MAEHLGVWEPFGVGEVEGLLRDAEFVWWLSGGVALDVFLEQHTRAHGDIDVSVRRADWPALRTFLSGRVDVRIAHNGVLSDVPEGALDDDVNGLWARNHRDGPWRLQINLEQSDGDDWVFRRDPRIRRPLTDVVWRRTGLPFVNPAVQLLWKVASIRACDEQDFAAVVPALPADERRWLADAIDLAYPAAAWAARARDAVNGHEVPPGRGAGGIVNVQTTEVLTAAQKASIIDLCIAAHEMEEFRNLFVNIPSARHFLVTRGSELVSHGMASTRWLQPEGERELRTAYVDAVSTLPCAQRLGYASAMMRRLAADIDDYEIACLQTDEPGFYERLGWELWRGPLGGRGEHGLVPTPAQRGVMVLRLARTPPIDVEAGLTIECQPARIWE